MTELGFAEHAACRKGQYLLDVIVCGHVKIDAILQADPLGDEILRTGREGQSQ